MKIKAISKAALIFALALITAVSVCSCSDSGSTAEPEVETIVNAIIVEYPLSDAMNKVEGEDKIKNVYGLTTEDYSEFAAYVNNSGTEQDEIVIVKAASPDKVAGIEEKLNNKLTAKLNSTKNYLPEQYSMIEKCEVKSNGNYVRMIISPDAEGMVAIYNKQFE